PGSGGAINLSLFKGNTATDGAGVAEQVTASYDSDNFTNNIATTEGGGVDVLGGSPTFQACNFNGNSAVGNPASIGGGINTNGQITLTTCSFVANSSTQSGGAVNINAGP